VLKQSSSIIFFIHRLLIAAKPRSEVEEFFRTLKHNDKWILSTGTKVEDGLYAFGKSQIEDHPSQSLIFDPNDSESYIKNGIFTKEEIEEIKIYKSPKPIVLPDDIKQYLNKFNRQSTADIRSVLNEKQSWEEYYDHKKHFDLDWIKHSVYTLVKEYENGSLMKDHLENWYNIHIWCIIDRVFGNLEGLEIIRWAHFYTFLFNFLGLTVKRL
jgi:predicted nuclease of restriction endonuclease-like RecB superfamily